MQSSREQQGEIILFNEQCKEIEENNSMEETRDLFKKSGAISGTFHARMSMIKDRNGKDLTEAEEIKKSWQEYTELYKKYLNDQDKHYGLVTQLEPDTLECEVKWALGSITTKLVEVIEFQLTYLKSFDAVKVLHSIYCKLGKLSSGHETGKGHFSFQFQRRAMSKNVQTTEQLNSFQVLARLCLKSFKLGFTVSEPKTSRCTAAAAKSVQSYPALCNPMDGSPPGSPVPGILQARILEWFAISFSSAWKWNVKAKLLSCVWLLATPWTAAYQAPPYMGFSRQEYWSGLPLPSPPDVLAGFRKGRGTRDQIANIRWIIEKAREFQKEKPI